MSATMPQGTRADLLNRVEKPSPAKAKLTINSVERAGLLLRKAIARSGVPHKALADDKGRFSRQLNGTEADRLWFHEMLATWPPEVWRELIALLAVEFGGEVERVIRVKEKSA